MTYVVLDGYAEGDAAYEWNLVQHARKLGYTKNLDYLRSNGVVVMHEASGIRAGVRGGEENFKTEVKLTREQLIDWVKANPGVKKLIAYDYTYESLRSKKIAIVETTDIFYELENNPFLNERWLVIDEFEKGVLSVYVVDPTQSGSTEFNHWTMGAGRVVTQPIVLADLAYLDGSAFQSKALQNALRIARVNGYVNMDFILQEAAIHASQRQLYAMMNFFLANGVFKFYFDIALDGRDEENGQGLVRLKTLVRAVRYFEKKYGRAIDLVIRRVEGRERMYQRAKDQDDVIRNSANYLLFGPEAALYRKGEN